MTRRLAEAARLGFTHALVPLGSGPAPDGITAVEVADVGAALLACRNLRLKSAKVAVTKR